MIKKLLRKTKYIPFDKFIQTKPVLLLLSLFDWPRQKIRQLYRWVVSWAEKKQAEQALAGVSFAESSFFPIPPDPLLIALVTAKPKRWVRFAAITTVMSILGGIFGYFIGLGLFETVGNWVIDTYHLHEEYVSVGERYSENAFVTIFTAAFTPIPYKLITIAAGAFHVNFAAFVFASLIGRGGRFFLVSGLMHHFGKRYQEKIEKYIDLLGLAFVVLLVLGVMALKFI